MNKFNQQVKNTVTFLLKKKLIKITGKDLSGENIYSSTDKGKKYLEKNKEQLNELLFKTK